MLLYKFKKMKVALCYKVRLSRFSATILADGEIIRSARSRLSTDVGLQISTKQTKLMANSAEIGIKLHGEALERVPEHTNVGQLIPLRSNFG